MAKVIIPIRSIRIIEKENGGKVYRFVASDESRDSHKSVLPVEGWVLERFNANPVIGYMHNIYGGDLCNSPDPDDVIGKGQAFVENGELITDIEFEPEEINPKAAKIEKKINFGSLKAVSVGFEPLEVGKWGEGEERQGGPKETYYYGKRELLEISIVNIPSNRNALKRNLRENTSAALIWIQRELGSDYSFSIIEKMTVGEILNLVEKDEKRGVKPIPPEENEQIDDPESLIRDITAAENDIIITEAEGFQFLR